MNLALKVLCLQAYSLLLVLYSLLHLAKLKPGWSRLKAALPAVALNLTVPLIFDPDAEPLLITPASGVLSQAAFKLLAWCFDRGPLTLNVDAYQFIAILLMPIIPYDVFTVSGGQRIPSEAGGAPRDTWQLLQDYAKQIGCATVVALVLAAYPEMHWFPKHWLYTLCSCMFLGGVFDLLGACSTSFLQVPVAPTFNRPWLSNSFADFWARRWNLTITYTMRVLVYEPIIEGHLMAKPRQAEASPSASPTQGGKPGDVPPPEASRQSGYLSAASDSASVSDTTDSSSLRGRASKSSSSGSVAALAQHAASPVKDTASPVPDAPAAATPNGRHGSSTYKRPSMLKRLIALQATFMFSGVWHILMFWYNTRTISWRWALFFIIQAPIVMCEALLSEAWRRLRLPRLPHALWVVATNAALIAIAGPLFFGPADDTGFAARNLASVQPVLVFLSKLRHSTVHPRHLSSSPAHCTDGTCPADILYDVVSA